VFFVSLWDNYYHQIGHGAKRKTAFKPLPHRFLFIKVKKGCPLMTTFFPEEVKLRIEKEQQ
jgi:hypothetical protein